MRDQQRGHGFTEERLIRSFTKSAHWKIEIKGPRGSRHQVCRSGKGAIGPPVGMNVVGSIKRSGVDTDKKISEGPIIKEVISHIRVVWASSEILVSKLQLRSLEDFAMAMSALLSLEIC
jgi:hypothetical protein